MKEAGLESQTCFLSWLGPRYTTNGIGFEAWKVWKNIYKEVKAIKTNIQ